MASDRVRVFEVGPRDGLQNEPRTLSVSDKLKLIRALAGAGIPDIEVGAFVRPDRVPQMANSDLVLRNIRRDLESNSGASFRPWALVPNRVGLDRALEVGVRHLAVFTAVSETFCKKNIGMSVSQSISEFQDLIQVARKALGKKLHVRAYLSTSFFCPFEDRISPARAMRTLRKLSQLEIDEISIGDTIGKANPNDVAKLLEPAIRLLGKDRIAVHFHDTRGTALANTLRALQMGIRTVDSSVGGIGGCPFAPGASGNLATEDLVYMLHGMGFKTGIDIHKLCKVSLEFTKKLKRVISSRYLSSYYSQCN